MRIPTKVSLGVGALALIVFGSLAVWQAKVERRDLARAVEEELVLTGRAMRVASQNALRDRQIGDLDATVSALEAIRADVDVLLFAPDGALRSASEGAIDAASRLDAATLARLSDQRPEIDLAADRAVLVVSLAVESTTVGLLVIARPLSDVQADLQRETASLAIAVLVFTIVVAALAYGLGELLVGRPLARLSKAMARVPAGEFHPTLDTHRTDEIGRLTLDFLAMLEELERAHSNLESEQDAHRRSMRALQDADRLAAIGQLSAGLAHEIGSPLQVLHGRARRILRHIDDVDEVRRAAELIADQAERITRIVRQLLDVARRRTRQVQGDPITAVRSVVELLQVEARRNKVELSLELDEELGSGTLESDPLQQITLNLTRNALQAAEPGGHVTLRLSRGTLLRPGSTEPISSLRLMVEDDGKGIPEPLRPRLFDPFFTTRSSEGGTGLGLAIVGTLVKELGGTVGVTSELGRGSRFIVDLPRAHRRHAADAEVA